MNRRYFDHKKQFRCHYQKISAGKTLGTPIPGHRRTRGLAGQQIKYAFEVRKLKKKVVIVGGVAGGASAAARLRRLNEQAEIILIERGGYISYANCGLPYYIGDVIAERDNLFVQTPHGLRTRYNIEVRTRHEVLKINRHQKLIEVKELVSGRVYQETYDVLLLSPGAAPIRPPIPGLDGDNVFTLRDVTDTDRIKAFLRDRQPRQALVVGAGFIGLEIAENLVAAGLDVALVEMAARVLPRNLDPEMAAPLHLHLRAHGVNLYLQTALSAVEQKDGRNWALLSNGERIPYDLAVIAVGAAPEARLAKEAGLELGTNGAIRVNASFQTSDPHIYAVGDAIEVESGITGEKTYVPLAGPANRQGRLAADAICGRPVKYEGAIGTAIVKVFALAAGTVGLTEDFLKHSGQKYLAAIVHPLSHAGYYPGATPLDIKLLFTPEGRILGAQVVGAQNVDKTLDVIAAIMKTGGTVDDLAALELAYAPPFSSAKNPVNIAGYVAGNIIRGDLPVVSWDQVLDQENPDFLLLDVRTKSQFAAGALDGALNIPLAELRQRLHELPKEKEIIVYCTVGLTSYLATRLLIQNGFKARNLSGGWRTLKAIREDRRLTAAAGNR
ncbi:MAG: FAD-dependent oxidoreductase [Firmicutes bacterium]|nr:FAD-dependent oxidoreductase [Bacillota bacterium]